MKSTKAPILAAVNVGILVIAAIILYITSSTGCRGTGACVNSSGLWLILGYILLAAGPIIVVALVIDAVWLYRRLRRPKA